MKVAFVLALVLGINSTASADPITLIAILNGAQESPPTTSPGTGIATVTFDPAAHILTVSSVFSGLLAPAVAAHIHCCTATPLTGNAGVATQVPSFSLFPLGATSGSFSQTYDTTQALLYNPAFLTANGGIPQAESALFAGLSGGNTYFNIHTTQFPGGEIRGFLVAAPEPATVVLVSVGLLGIVAVSRKRRTI